MKYCDTEEMNKITNIKQMLPNNVYRKTNNELTLCKFTYNGKKEGSPNTLDFYISRGFNKKDSQHLLNKFRSHFNPFVYKNTGKTGRPCSVGFWIDKGYTPEQAKQMIYEFQIQSIKFFVTYYGEEDGIKRYQEVYEKKQLAYKQRYEKCLDRIAKNKKISVKKARELNRQSMIAISPRTTVYWQNKGFSLLEAKAKVRQWQSEMSPRTVHYWIERGFSHDEAKKRVSEYQSHNSISQLAKRYNCTESQALELQELIYKQNADGLIYRNKTDDKNKMKFLLYSSKVRIISEANYRRYKNIIDPRNLRGRDYHMDHAYSVFNGYLKSVPPEIIGSRYNLHIIKKTDNIIKKNNNSITLRELYKKINENNTHN